jgi:hypothetical protein
MLQGRRSGQSFELKWWEIPVRPRLEIQLILDLIPLGSIRCFPVREHTNVEPALADG